MSKVGGTVYSNREFIEGYVEFGEGRIVDVVTGDVPDDCIATGLVLPLLSNCHTHIGDSALRGVMPEDLPLEEIVRPPDGLKHRRLAECSDEMMIAAIGKALEELRAAGTGRFVDFREGGLKGLQQMRAALSRNQFPIGTVLSRPVELRYDEKEIDRLLDDSDGIGVSALSDWDHDELRKVADHTKKRGKLFALHASEACREDIAEILDLSPDFLVHMASATDEDLKTCRERNTPVIVCPRSNAIFGIELDIVRMLDIGVEVCLGTDNAMFNTLSIIDEMRAAYSSGSNSRQLLPAEVFRLAIENSQKVLSMEGLIGIRPGGPCELMVVSAGRGSTPEEVLRTDQGCSIELICNGSSVWRYA